jgi:hypothetical protein
MMTQKVLALASRYRSQYLSMPRKGLQTQYCVYCYEQDSTVLAKLGSSALEKCFHSGITLHLNNHLQSLLPVRVTQHLQTTAIIS